MAVKTLPSKSRTSSSSSTKIKSSANAASKQAVKPRAGQVPAKGGKKKASSKFKDASSREALDSQTLHILHDHSADSKSKSSAVNGNEAGSSDPFSYGAGTEQQRRQTRKQVEATADAFNALCDLMK